MKTPRFWQHDSLLSQALLPLATLYRLGATLDRRFTPAQSSPIPCIAIGNVTAGGAGKTPTALALAALLQQCSATPHFISRGYGGSAQRVTHVHAESDWRVVGDEALLLANAATTFVAAKRLDAAHAAAQNAASCVIADDALQHYALKADATLLVIDGAYGIGNGKLLPAGPLRETLTSALSRTDAVIMIGEDYQNLSATITRPVFRATLEVTGDTAFLAGKKWLAFAGLGRPEKFYTLLRQHGATLVETVDFADHHPYTEQDIAALQAQADTLGASLITTAKDAVKLPAHYRDSIAVLPVQLKFAQPESLLKLLKERGIF